MTAALVRMETQDEHSTGFFRGVGIFGGGRMTQPFDGLPVCGRLLVPLPCRTLGFMLLQPFLSPFFFCVGPLDIEPE